MSDLTDRIAAEHPNYVSGGRRDRFGPYCKGCGEAISSDPDYTVGWHQHIIEVTEAAVRAQIAADIEAQCRCHPADDDSMRCHIRVSRAARIAGGDDR